MIIDKKPSQRITFKPVTEFTKPIQGIFALAQFIIMIISFLIGSEIGVIFTGFSTLIFLIVFFYDNNTE